MDDGASSVIGLIIFMGLLILEVIFYGFWAAVDNSSDIVIDKQADQGDKKARTLQKYMDRPSESSHRIQMLSAILLVALSMTETILFPKQIWIVIVMSGIIIFAGIFAAQKIAARKPAKWAYGLVGFMNGLLNIFGPVFWLLEKGSDVILRMGGMNPEQNVDDVTEDEIISMVNDGHEQGVLQESEAEMIQNIFAFGDKEAKDIMTHRKHIVAVDAAMTFEEAMQFMLEKSNSRFPVFQEDMDNVIGVIHIKDVLAHSQEKELFYTNILKIEGLVREIDLIPETRNINALFKEMQSTKTHMVIVVDEYGQTAGLVAMEDILEEIVGNILDEYDEEDEMVQMQPDGSVIMQGMTPLEQVREILQVELDEEDYETLNGFLISKIDKIPNDGDTFSVRANGFLFEITLVRNKIIQSVKIRKLLPQEEKEEIEPCQKQERMVE